MFWKLLLVQKEAGGRVCFFLQMVFPSLRKVVAESPVLVSTWGCVLCLFVCLCVTRARAAQGLSLVVVCKWKMSVFSSKILQGKLWQPKSGFFPLVAPFAVCIIPSDEPVLLLLGSNPCGGLCVSISRCFGHPRHYSSLAGPLLPLKSSFVLWYHRILD